MHGPRMQLLRGPLKSFGFMGPCLNWFCHQWVQLTYHSCLKRGVASERSSYYAKMWTSERGGAAIYHKVKDLQP